MSRNKSDYNEVSSQMYECFSDPGECFSFIVDLVEMCDYIYALSETIGKYDCPEPVIACYFLIDFIKKHREEIKDLSKIETGLIKEFVKKNFKNPNKKQENESD